MVREIPLANSENSDIFALVDDDDFDLVSRYHWTLSSHGRNTQYANHDRVINGVRMRFLMHRLLTEAPKRMVVDHINGNGLDNRRSNLRLCTITENLWNQPKRIHGTSSRFRCVSFCRQTGKWSATVRASGRKHWLGRFNSEIEAAMAVDDALIELHGEFASLNFPDRRKVG